MRAQYFHYKIIETLPISKLEEFKDHPRLRVFYHKGCTCLNCGVTATIIAKGKIKNTEHWDVYTDTYYPLTVDHIVPRSRGGSNDLQNLQPLCYKCNQKKGSSLPGEDPFAARIYDCIGHTCKWPRFSKLNFKRVTTKDIGKITYKLTNKKMVRIGKIAHFELNPYTGKTSAVILDKPGSWYHINKLYTHK